MEEDQEMGGFAFQQFDAVEMTALIVHCLKHTEKRGEERTIMILLWYTNQIILSELLIVPMLSINIEMLEFGEGISDLPGPDHSQSPHLLLLLYFWLD